MEVTAIAIVCKTDVGFGNITFNWDINLLRLHFKQYQLHNNIEMNDKSEKQV